MSDASSTAPRSTSKPWIGPAALLAVPIAAVADTWLAFRRGWQADSPMIVQAAMAAALMVAVVVLLALAIGPLRRALVFRGSQIALIVLGCVLGWGIAEAGLRYVFRLPAFHRRSPGVVYHFKPDPFEMYKVSGEDTRTTYNALGIRGDELPEDDDTYRILAIGGSTTECLYLDDTETWPARLQQQLNSGEGARYWVGNAGHGDLATGHHLRWIRSGRLPRECDCLLLLVGVNDLMRYLLRLDDGEQPPPLWYRSGMVLLLRDFWNGKLQHGIVWDTTGEKLLGIHRRGFPIPPWPEGEPTWDVAIDGYQRRIRAIHEAARAAGVRVVFATQPVLWDDYLSPDAEKRLCIARVDPYPRKWDYLTAANLRTIIDRYNEALETTCDEIQADWIDAALPLSGMEAYFYDDYHLNEDGCRAMADLVAEWMREHLSPSQSGTTD